MESRGNGRGGRGQYRGAQFNRGFSSRGGRGQSRRGQFNRGFSSRGGRTRPEEENDNKRYQSRQDVFKNRPVKTAKDVFYEIRSKMNPNLKNPSSKIFNELDKFNTIITLIIHDLKEEEQIDAFFKICELFTLEDLRNCKDMNMQSSIYSIFFDNKSFRFRDIMDKLVLSILMKNVSEYQITLMFDFFKVLIDVSIYNSEILENTFQLFEKASSLEPSLKSQVDNIRKYSEQTKEKGLNSFESVVSPTANDLFHCKTTSIDNHPGRRWETFKKYKETMIILTKENFYIPFRKSLDELRRNDLDRRDLFLYENVQIAFTPDIENYEVFKDCNLFLKFKIRSLPSWTKKLEIPDWRFTDRLGNRSLLILSESPDLIKINAVCRSCAVARSLDEKLSKSSIVFLNKGILPVVLVSGQISANQEYYMFEPTSCWPAVQPVLQRLMKMSELFFPQYFINPITKLDFSKNELLDKNLYQTNVLSLNYRGPEGMMKTANDEWTYDHLSDEAIDTSLRVDHEQYKALRYALKHNLTLVNGAPGTGKTHFAREFIRLMSETHEKPIFIVTFTNHALDAIMEGVISFYQQDQILRWGGPMRSTNEILKKRQWRNCYLSEGVRNIKDEIVTMKQNLKNMYNIRQMAHICIKKIKKDPQDIKTYIDIMNVLDHFFQASQKIKSFYPIDLNQNEIIDYCKYLKSKNERINHEQLPDEKRSALECWLYGEAFYNRRNKRIREVFEYNKKIVEGEKYENTFANLANSEDYNYEEEEDESDDYHDKDDAERPKKHEKKIGPNPDDIITKEFDQQMKSFDDDSQDQNQNQNIDDKENKEEEEEEEEEQVDDKIYNDEDMAEMTRVSFDGTKAFENLPPKYVHDFLENKFKILYDVKKDNNKKTPGQLMIEYLMAISEPLTQMIDSFEKKLNKNEISLNESETREAGNYLKRMKLIGMTSTVASVRKEALEVAGSEIMIVEEAGELTESMLSCILPSTLKRLILIGDYQQLRPKVEHEMTKTPFYYDISLFEKLVRSAKEQKADCLFTLSVQRRMHPQICQLVRNAFYSDGEEKIIDAPTTANLGIPYGIPHRVRFFMHQYEENKVSTRSHVNKQEAKFCASLVPFFICRGYKPQNITIIALYKGQKFEIEREIQLLYEKCKKERSSKLYDPFGQIRNSKQIKVVVLDNFQGEENDIIIVSLTRSERPGFVKNRNRALVTLSRAREMLVVLGHERIFGPNCKGNEQWAKISKVAKELSEYSMSRPNQNGLAINRCLIHKPNSINCPAYLDNPESIFKFRFSFCMEKCNYQLPCGHACQLTCHCHNYPPGEHEHDDYYCQFRCQRTCPNGHQCKGTCGICTHKGGCPNCRVKIRHEFEKCHHVADIECFLVTSGRARCRAECGKTLERCGHPCKLQCGHEGPCNCKIKLTKVCEDCRRTIEYYCGTEPICEKKCIFVLPCGHRCQSRCFECSKRQHHDTVCRSKCDFVFPCGHKCTHICSDKLPYHQHFYCTKNVYLPHNFFNNHGDDLFLKQECSMKIRCNLPCQHACNVCHKHCNKKCGEKCIQRCNCRCTNFCKICHKRCRALSGEKCAIFCEHFMNVEEPPQDVGLLYVFHDNHFLPLNEAKEKIRAQYESIALGISEVPVPIKRLTCPCDGCTSDIPCILGSWLFDEYNKNIEDILGRIREAASAYICKQDEKPYEKINWYICQKCGQLFFVKFSDPDYITINCPNCGMQKGDMFE